jgi:hypothetical protein
MSANIAVQGDPAKASVKDTFAVIADVMLPTLAKGVLIRRSRMVRLSVRLGLDERAVKRLQGLRSHFGGTFVWAWARWILRWHHPAPVAPVASHVE